MKIRGVAILAGFLLAAFPASSHEQLDLTLKKLDARIQATPGDLDLRSRRAWLLLDHGFADKAGEDILALRADSKRAEEGYFLEASRFRHQGKAKEAKASLLKSLAIRSIPGKHRLLGEIERDLGNLDAALTAMNQALAQGGGDEVFVLLLDLHRAKGSLPRTVWKMAMAEYPGHPAIMDGLYAFCPPAPEGAGWLAKCEDMTRMAVATWWPESVDWRLRHARILLEAGKAEQIGPLLAEALERLDAGSMNRGGDAEAAMEKRREVFALMKAAQAVKAK